VEEMYNFRLLADHLILLNVQNNENQLV